MTKILYKLLLLFLVSECSSQAWFPDHEGCTKMYTNTDDSEKCTHKVYCNQYVSHLPLSRNDECQNFVYDQYGHIYNPLSIFLKQDQRESYDNIPNFSDGSNRYMVYSLDLSGNTYVSVPNLGEMDNLAVLKITRCGLYTAKLSNIYPLPALLELDYSENTINNIAVVPGENAYTTLRKLNISHNYLVNIPEAIFDSFANLETLDLSHNFLYQLDILTFEGLRKLLYLNLSNNRIANIDTSLLRLRYLVTLDLSHNILDTLKASDFGKLSSLQELKLDSNEINSIERNIFENMASLTTLDLRDNNLENIAQDTFVNATRLTSVNLSRNKFKTLPKNMFNGKTIFNFTIEGNELEGALERGYFDGLGMVTELDLSGQYLTSIGNYAFAGLQNMKTLSLNNNDMELLSNYSFKGLQNLNYLDLSYNKIVKMDIVTEDLISLQILSLQHNKIVHISSNNFAAMGALQFLDLSHNKISHLDSNSFRTLQSLLNFKISDNPLSGSLEEKTFDGLSSLPCLDISGTEINAINNGTFTGMTALRDLNVSHSNITEMEYNSLSYANNIQTIDLSYNLLNTFNVNTTDLTNLKTIILNNNTIQVISETFFNGMTLLNTVVLSHNRIGTIHKQAFVTLEDMRVLDMSYNPDLEFDVSLVEKAQNLAKLFLSGTKAEAKFDNMNDIPLTKLEMAHSNIQNISHLNLYKLQRLETLMLTHNAVSRLEVGALTNLTALKQLDISYNNLSYIQPGAFKDCVYLNLLNISHNKLVEINYGIFRGLLYLEIMDLSYNYLKSLHRTMFYDVEHLSILIVDHNDIKVISEEEFLGTSLTKLSIGGNPLPCEILANIDKKGYELTITAVNIDETNENVKGVTCNKDHHYSISPMSPATAEHDKLLLDIRNILYNVSKGQIVKENETHNDNSNIFNMTKQQLTLYEKFSSVANLTSALVNLNNDTNILLQKLSQNSVNSITNMTSTLVNVNTNTNLLLGKLLRELSSKDSISIPNTKPIISEKESVTSDNLIPFINKVKQNLEETIAMEKQNIIIDLDSKIEKLKSSVFTTKTPVHEKLVGNNENTQKSSMFTEVCVGLILVILVGFILFKVYKSRLYIPNGRSITSSTRNIADAMESSHL